MVWHNPINYVNTADDRPDSLLHSADDKTVASRLRDEAINALTE